MKVLKRVLVFLCVVTLSVSSVVSAEATTAEELAPIIGTLIEDTYDDYEIKYSETMVIVYVAKNGLASQLQTAYEAGEDENYAPWVECKSSLKATYDAISALLVLYGRSDICLQMWLWNDASRNGERSCFINNLAYVGAYGVDDYAMIRFEDAPIESNMPDDIKGIHDALDRELQSSFDYHTIFYNEKLNRFIIEIAVNGFAEKLWTAKQSGCDETWPMWVEIKTVFNAAYQSTVDMIAAMGRPDITVDLRLVNDEVHIHQYYDRINFDPLYQISMGIELSDVMR